jgi:hypothetical protein
MLIGLLGDAVLARRKSSMRSEAQSTDDAERVIMSAATIEGDTTWPRPVTTSRR